MQELANSMPHSVESVGQNMGCGPLVPSTQFEYVGMVLAYFVLAVLPNFVQSRNSKKFNVITMFVFFGW